MDLGALPRNNGPWVRSRKSACSAQPLRSPSNAREKRAACEGVEYSHERLWWPSAAIAATPQRAQRRYLEVKCDGCGTHNTVDLTIIRRPKEQCMRCKPCSEQRSYLTSAAIWCGCGAARLRPKTTYPDRQTAEGGGVAPPLISGRNDRALGPAGPAWRRRSNTCAARPARRQVAAGGVHTWPISEVATPPGEVRFVAHGGLDLLTLNFFAFWTLSRAQRFVVISS